MQKIGGSSEISVVVSDIGGTNARFQLARISLPSCTIKLGPRDYYKSKDFRNTSEALRYFLKKFNKRQPNPEYAVFAVAGKLVVKQLLSS